MDNVIGKALAGLRGTILVKPADVSQIDALANPDDIKKRNKNMVLERIYGEF
jgi:hypothetical protein